MKSHSDNRWPEYTVPELFEKLPVGKRYEQKSVFPKGNVPVIDQGRSGVIGYHNEEPGVRASEQNPIVTFANHTCQISLQTRDFSVIQNVFPLKARAGFDICFLYFLTKDSIHFSEYKGHWPDFERLKFQVPPIEVQIKIAKILGDLDRKIELNRRMNETLEQIGQRLLKHYFLENPERENWDNRTLGEFFPIRTGKKDANFSTPDGQYPFFTCSQNSLKAPDYSFDGAAILLAGNGDFNIKFYRGKFEAYQRTYVLIPHNEKFLGLLYFLMSQYLSEITGGSRGSVIKFITKGMIEDYIVKLPDDEQLSEVSGQFNKLTIAIEKNRAQIKTLETIRDTLLPKLMDGSIEI